MSPGHVNGVSRTEYSVTRALNCGVVTGDGVAVHGAGMTCDHGLGPSWRRRRASWRTWRRLEFRALRDEQRGPSRAELYPQVGHLRIAQLGDQLARPSCVPAFADPHFGHRRRSFPGGAGPRCPHRQERDATRPQGSRDVAGASLPCGAQRGRPAVTILTRSCRDGGSLLRGGATGPRMYNTKAPRWSGRDGPAGSQLSTVRRCWGRSPAMGSHLGSRIFARTCAAVRQRAHLLRNWNAVPAMTA
jgi:hypothetical protein